MPHYIPPLAFKLLNYSILQHTYIDGEVVVDEELDDDSASALLALHGGDNISNRSRKMNLLLRELGNRSRQMDLLLRELGIIRAGIVRTYLDVFKTFN